MTNILLIETATNVCSIGLSSNGRIVSIKESFDQRSHAELITIFIAEVLREANISFQDLDAVAVSKGPGSYTGLRIGVSSAKGICFAIDKPLIAIDTLYALSVGFRETMRGSIQATDLLCPMIDARRMEVYSTLFDSSNKVISPTQALIIDHQSFSNELETHRIWFFGDGASKCKNAKIIHKNAIIVDNFFPSVHNMSLLAHEQFNNNQFENVAYFEPFYLKDFIAGLPKVKGLE